MRKERLAHGLTDLLVCNARQQFDQICHAAAHGGNPFGLEFFLVGIQVVRQAAQIGVKKQSAVVEPAIHRFAIGGAGHFAISVGRFDHQIVTSGGFRRHAERIERVEDDGR